MFENLTKNEKRYAIALGALVPCVLIFFGFMSFVERYKQNKTMISTKDSQIQKEKTKALDALTANTRRGFYYRKVSFPTDKENITEYQDWLEQLIRECGLSYTSISKQKTTRLTHKSSVDQTVYNLGEKDLFVFDAKGTLDQIIQFCYEFDEVDLLHRIKELTLKPIFVKNELSGKCSATFRVELLTLEDADEERNVFAMTKPLPRSLEEYTNIVVSRNIFGPANNAPRLSLSSKSYQEDDEISFALAGRDDDKNDVLRYEIIDDGGLKDATIEEKKTGKRMSYKFVSPAQPIGEYKVKLRVIDSGFPEKSDEAECKITVKAKPPKQPEREIVEETPPPTRFAGSTQINRISKSRTGRLEVKIRCRPTGQVFELTIDDEFELDDQEWIVREIGETHVELETDGKLLTFGPGAFLDNPSSETPLKEADGSEVSSTGK